MVEDLAYWVALSTSSKIGARTFAKILACYDSLEKMWTSSPQKLASAGLTAEIVNNIEEVKKQKNPEEELKKVKNLGISITTIKDKNYPKILKEIPDPPAVLYIKGEILPEDNLAIGIVGARKFTSYGQRVAEDLAYNLANSGLTVISGLALGIDGIAHKSVLKTNNGRTIAVLANGLDQIYPYSHKTLAEKIIAGRGALVSEFPLGMPALRYNFPVRNRIIAGLSLGVIVVEGALKSGSLLTARAALDYNREVFAVPGNIFSEASTGPNGLIKMGAKAITNAEDVLSELNISVKIQEESVKKIVPDTKDEALVLQFLAKNKPIHIDKLLEKTKLGIATLNSCLILMEMKGKVRNLGGAQYILGR